MGKVGRNDPCPCGSGQKYKKCCLHKAEPASPFESALEVDARPGHIPVAAQVRFDAECWSGAPSGPPSEPPSRFGRGESISLSPCDQVGFPWEPPMSLRNQDARRSRKSGRRVSPSRSMTSRTARSRRRRRRFRVPA